MPPLLQHVKNSLQDGLHSDFSIVGNQLGKRLAILKINSDLMICAVRCFFIYAYVLFFYQSSMLLKIKVPCLKAAGGWAALPSRLAHNSVAFYWLQMFNR